MARFRRRRHERRRVVAPRVSFAPRQHGATSDAQVAVDRCTATGPSVEETAVAPSSSSSSSDTATSLPLAVSSLSSAQQPSSVAPVSLPPTFPSVSSATAPRRFALLHVRIRNDEHCPACRRCYVSFHRTPGDAIGSAASQILDDADRTEAVASLRATGRCWVDEWERRRNGDSFRVCRLVDGTEWDLQDTERIVTVENGDRKGRADDAETKSIPPAFMALRIAVDRRVACPDNIEFYVDFHRTAEDAANRLLIDCAGDDDDDDDGGGELSDDERDAAPEADGKRDRGDGNEENDDDDDDDRKRQAPAAVVRKTATDRRRSKLVQCRPVWLRADFVSRRGQHLQVVAISHSYGETLLNDYCPQIRPDLW